MSVSAKFQLPSMSRSGGKVCCGGWWGGLAVLCLTSTRVEFELELSFDNFTPRRPYLVFCSWEICRQQTKPNQAGTAIFPNYYFKLCYFSRIRYLNRSKSVPLSIPAKGSIYNPALLLPFPQE